jgi:hypothetical protein
VVNLTGIKSQEERIKALELPVYTVFRNYSRHGYGAGGEIPYPRPLDRGYRNFSLQYKDWMADQPVWE